MSARGEGGSGAPPRSDPGADPLAGATIVVHDLSRPTSSTATPSTPPPPAPSGVAWQTKVLRGAGIGLALLVIGYFGVRVYQGRELVPITAVPVGVLGGPARVEIRVHVDGAVAQPGVYRLAQGDRVEDAIKAAGGLTDRADSSRVNLAQRVRDEQRLDVPSLPAPRADAPSAVGQAAPESTPAPPANTTGGTNSGPTANPTAARTPTTPRPTSTPRPAATQRPEPTPRATAFSGGRINVNTATQAQLEQLPGLGTTSARRIVDYRTANGPFRSLDDLRKTGVQDQFLRPAAEFLTFD